MKCKTDVEEAKAISGNGTRDNVPALKLTDIFLKTFTQKLEGKKRELVVRGNDLFLRKRYRLVDADMETICSWLKEHPEVTAVDLSYNRLTNIAMQTLADFLAQTSHVTRLNLMCNDIGCEGVQRLAELGKKLTLKSLRLNGNKFGSEGGKHLAQLLSNNGNLLHLDVAETDQTASGLAYLLAVLHSDNKTLQLLDLSRPLTSHSHAADTIGLMLQANTSLKELHLQKFGFDDVDMEQMMLGVSKNQTLVLLDLSCNSLGCEAAELLAQYLLTRPQVRALLLGHNNIPDHGAESLSRGLPSSRVKMLDLAANQISDAGLQQLLYTIKKPFMLTTLYLWGNGIGKNTARMLRRMLYSGVLVQDKLDVIVYRVDKELRIAHNPVDRYRHIYYCVGDYGLPPPIRFKPPRPDHIPTQLVFPHRHKVFIKEQKGFTRTPCICLQCATVAVHKFQLTDSEYFEELVRELATRVPDATQQGETSELQDDRCRSIHSSLQRRSATTESDTRVLHGLVPLENQSETFSSVPDVDVSEKMVQTSDISFQGTPRFSVQYEPPYPIYMVSPLQQQEEVSVDIDILKDVQAGYVRKYQQPADEDEEYDLSDDPKYNLTTAPLAIIHDISDVALQSDTESISESQSASPSPSEASRVSAEEDLATALSKYQLLEKNIHGVEPEVAEEPTRRMTDVSRYWGMEHTYAQLAWRQKPNLQSCESKDVAQEIIESVMDEVGTAVTHTFESPTAEVRVSATTTLESLMMGRGLETPALEPRGIVRHTEPTTHSQDELTGRLHFYMTEASSASSCNCTESCEIGPQPEVAEGPTNRMSDLSRYVGMEQIFAQFPWLQKSNLQSSENKDVAHEVTRDFEIPPIPEPDKTIGASVTPTPESSTAPSLDCTTEILDFYKSSVTDVNCNCTESCDIDC